jgi:hypothetical protein
MNKRGFIKTLEAVLAIMVVFIFIFSVSQKSDKKDSNAEAMRNIQEGILNGISQNDIFRNCIINTPDGELNLIPMSKCGDIKTYIEGTIPPRFGDRYFVQVCGEVDCQWNSPDENYLYTSAVIISSELENPTPSSYNPRIFRIWMW